MNLKNLFNYLDNQGISYLENGKVSPHWILPEGKLYKKKEILTSIFLCLDKPELRYSYFYVQKNKKTHCGNERCVHPDCHCVSMSHRTKTVDNGFSSEDIVETSQEIDLETYYKLGKNKFLETYNENQPDFLKLTAKQLDLVIKYMENKNND